MTLSVVILFTDRDYMLLEKAVSSIKEHIKFNDYEVIAVDNREQNKTPLNLLDVKIITNEKNLYTFEGRRSGFKHTSGKYIWNFDVDDLMIDDLYLEDFPEEEKDFIQFGYTYDDKHKKDVALHKYPACYGNNVWSRFYNRNILEKVYSRLEKPVIVPKFEDKLLFDQVWSFHPKYGYIDKKLYQYNTLNSVTNKNLKTNVEKLGFDSYYYVYGLLGRLDFADSIKRAIITIIQAEERKCQSLKKSNNLNIQKS